MSEQICPHLGLKKDPATHTAYPSLRNFCHRSRPTERVDLSHQKSFCFDYQYQRCPVFQEEEGKVRLPRELRAQAKKKGAGRWARITFAAGLLVGIVFILGWIGRGFPFQALFSPPTPTPVVVTLREEPTGVLPTETPIPSPTVLLTNTPGNTPTLTPAPTMTRTPFPTTGPDVETLFGPEDQFLIHIVQEGESFYYLSDLYQTNPEVIKATNELLVQDSLLMGTNLLLMPGRVNVGDMPRFDVLYVDQVMRVEDVAEDYGVPAEDLRYYNELGGETILPDRWLIIPLTQ